MTKIPTTIRYPIAAAFCLFGIGMMIYSFFSPDKSIFLYGVTATLMGENTFQDIRLDKLEGKI